MSHLECSITARLRFPVKLLKLLKPLPQESFTVAHEKWHFKVQTNTTEFDVQSLVNEVFAI